MSARTTEFDARNRDIEAEMQRLTPGLSDEWRGPLDVIKRESQRATELTNHLFIFAGRGRLHTEPVSLPLVVTHTLALLRARIGREIQLKTAITSDLPSIQADRSHVGRMMMNLMLNALEALKAGGVLLVHTRLEHLDADALATFQHCEGQPGDFAIVQVEDSGPGIDPTVLPRIFDPFFTTKFMGRGLGLAAVLGIVHSHSSALRPRTSTSSCLTG